ncbi:hypothetical protein [Corynebacterium cystitidis]|uniref:hypothetical protein n=1 Tax=Corynebacterium cystitidis TaxID=35757 RepID=UPI00211DAB6D|nr:hypothetical protein [Corynebacterium cystitidis]
MGKVQGTKLWVLDTELDIVNASSPEIQGELATALIRPEQLIMTKDPSALYTVIDHQLRGMFSSVTVQGSLGKGYLRVDLPSREAAEYPVGEKVALRVARTDTVVDTPNDDEIELFRRLEQQRVR